MELKFFICEHCGNLIAMINNEGVPVVCCGDNMTELVPGTVDASAEKHTPIYEVKGDKVSVNVGSTPHPMQDDHYIQWVFIQTKCGNQMKALTPDKDTKVCFALCDGDELEGVFAYCNLHGLWRS